MEIEVVIKPDHPPVKSPGVLIPPEKNAILFDGLEFFVFEEKLDPSDTRASQPQPAGGRRAQRHALPQWPKGQPKAFREQIPDDIRFNPPVIHV